MTPFATTFRGYDRTAVDAFVKKITDALASDDPKLHARARADAQAVTFPTAWRGYNVENVDHYLRRIARGRDEADKSGPDKSSSDKTSSGKPGPDDTRLRDEAGSGGADETS